MAYEVTTGIVRFSYVHIVEPVERPGQRPKYSLALLIPKSDKATKAKLSKALKDCYEDAVKNLWGGRRPTVPAVIKDGDGTKEDGSPYAAECHGHWLINVSSVSAPWEIGRAHV